MSVNPPEPENFANTVTETVETQTTVEHPNAVYLGDVQAAQLAIYQANVENRKPDFTNINPNAVRMAGYDPKTRKPLSAPGVGEPLITATEQTPIVNESSEPNTAPVEADPAKLGQAKADGDTKVEYSPEDEWAAKAAVARQSVEGSIEKGAQEVKAQVAEGTVNLNEPPADRDAVAQKAAAELKAEDKAAAKKSAKPSKKAAANTTTKKAATSKRAQKAAAARKAAKK